MYRPTAIALALVVSSACAKEEPRPVNEVVAKAPAKAPASEEPDSSDAGASTAKSSEAIAWMDDEKSARERAMKTGKPLLIDFSAKWCAPCEEMEDKTFSDARVTRLIRDRFVAVRIDATSMSESVEEQMKRHEVAQLPVIIVESPRAATLARWTDFVPPDEFLAALEKHAHAR